MIADLANGALGILLVYIAILRQPFLHSSKGSLFEVLAGPAIVLLAIAALKYRDAWYSRVLIPLGAALTAFAVLADFVPLPVTLESWFVFWIGVFTAVVALWGLFYPHNLEQPQPHA